MTYQEYNALTDYEKQVFLQRIVKTTAYKIRNFEPISRFEIFNPLPDGYTRLEYIESTGTQYIDTGLKWKYGYSINLDFTSINNKGNYCLFGASNGSAYNNGEVSCFWYDGRFDRVVPTSNTDSVNGTFNSYLSNTRYTLTYDNNITKAITKEDIYSLQNNVYNNYVGNNSIWLFSTHRTGNPYCAIFKLHGEKMFNENNQLIQYLIPSKRISDSVSGLYDIVTNTFLTNAGTGVFIAGPEV